MSRHACTETVSSPLTPGPPSSGGIATSKKKKKTVVIDETNNVVYTYDPTYSEALTSRLPLLRRMVEFIEKKTFKKFDLGVSVTEMNAFDDACEPFLDWGGEPDEDTIALGRSICLRLVDRPEDIPFDIT